MAATPSESRSAATVRGPLSGISALLVFSLFLGVSLNAAKPAMQGPTPGSAAERIAVRQLTASLARAVRHLVGSDQHKPCLHPLADGGHGIVLLARRPVRDERLLPPGVMLLRSGLLDLPPPADRLA
jgi:hypothetical protein